MVVSYQGLKKTTISEQLLLSICSFKWYKLILYFSFRQLIYRWTTNRVCLLFVQHSTKRWMHSIRNLTLWRHVRRFLRQQFQMFISRFYSFSYFPLQQFVTFTLLAVFFFYNIDLRMMICNERALYFCFSIRYFSHAGIAP